MFAYHVSLSVRDLLTKAMGWPFWMMQALSPLSEVSHWRVTGLFLS